MKATKKKAPKGVKVYNVWVVVEEQDTKTGDGVDVGLPDKLYASRSFEDAAAFVRSLPGWEEQGETSDYREGEGLSPLTEEA